MSEDGAARLAAAEVDEEAVPARGVKTRRNRGQPAGGARQGKVDAYPMVAQARLAMPAAHLLQLLLELRPVVCRRTPASRTRLSTHTPSGADTTLRDHAAGLHISLAPSGGSLPLR
jgi:hypothetical protein